MILCFVQHEGSNKIFLFECDRELALKVYSGDTVICNTRYGDVKGNIAAAIEVAEEQAKVIAQACRATWPLAKILRKYEKPVITSIDEIPLELIEFIRKQTIESIIAQISPGDRLPFDM